ncbi:HAD family hydrolase [Massilia sp. S19_KUP03_FR1]|uniref:HAD family hydrolase n=1 Tax=Massilia sp. S19_KUP03_FR1 TaxID=3025503 RepID=UPI002FCD7EE7
MIRAFLFDMDGTIVDNMGFHTDSWVEFFKRRDRTIDRDAFFLATAGRHGREIIRDEMGAHLTEDEVVALNSEKEVVYRELYGPHLKTVAGFEALVLAARADGVKLAVATAAQTSNVTFTLDGLDIRKHFDAVVTAADVPRGKPHPDVFLEAARRVGALPENCIVFEDAPLGVEAARRAGMRCVVITTTLPASAFAAFDNVILIVDHFTDLSVADVFAASPIQ